MEEPEDPIADAEDYAAYGNFARARKVLHNAARRDPSLATKCHKRIAELEQQEKDEATREEWVKHFRGGLLLVFVLTVFGSVWDSPLLSGAGTLVLVAIGLGVWLLRVRGKLPGGVPRHAAALLSRDYVVKFPPLKIPEARSSAHRAIAIALLALALFSSGALLCSVMFDAVSADLFSYYPCTKRRCDMQTPSPWTLVLLGLGLSVLGLSCVAYFFSDRVGGVLLMLGFAPIGVACMRPHAIEWGHVGDMVRVVAAALFVAAVLVGAVWLGRGWGRARDTD